MKKSSLCAQVYGWWKDYLENPSASREWGDSSHSYTMMEVYSRSQIPLIHQPNRVPPTAGKVSIVQIVGWGRAEGQSKHIYFFSLKFLKSILVMTSVVYFASLGMERQVI